MTLMIIFMIMDIQFKRGFLYLIIGLILFLNGDFVQVTLKDLVASAESTMSEYYAENSRKNVLSHLRQLCVS